MSRNRDIRGFFKPGSTESFQFQQATSSQPALELPSSPTTPPKSTSKPLSWNDEIKCSDDDEDNDSDESLISFNALLERKQGPPAYKREPNTTTPQAKRIASYSHNSPLTLRQKKHKFDLKSLISHARQTDRAEESARRADELITEEDDDDHHNLSDVQNSPTRLQKAARDLLNSDEEEAKGDKLARAMNRTKVDGSRRVSYFFNLEQPLFKSPRRPFPSSKAKGHWRVLADSRSRTQAFIVGLPHNMVSRGKTLSDELFLWVLDEVCVEKNAQLRVQYRDLVTLCTGSITRLVNDVKLYSILERLGGPKYSGGHTKLQISPDMENPYSGRDWTGLVTFLQLLERIAPYLETANATSAIQLLLRMALDPLAKTTIRNEHFTAMEALISALPRAGTRQWDNACETICSYLYESVEENVLRVVPINYMPNTTSKAVDLRRRMAAVTLFGVEAAMGGRPVDDVITIDDIMRRLDADDFQVSRTTDFENLRALVTLLDIVVGQAGFVHSTAGAETASAAADDDDSADRRFDARIDGLTFRLKMVHDKIHDNTLLSRKLTKASIDAVGKRLTYAVRTRPPPKTSIFEPEPEDEMNVPKQRAFMKNWAQRKKADRGAAAALANGGSGSSSRQGSHSNTGSTAG
ncbi:hypothetical protein F4779DRAFT_561300 [Xylariaceae sp. FL0662B]|nr:hypothetical protein F4779DRAFT_561300 [Xylariaceae sp. FL0662B]